MDKIITWWPKPFIFYISPLLYIYLRKKEILVNYRSNEIVYFRILILRGAKNIELK